MRTDKKLITYAGLPKIRHRHKEQKIVLTTGCYDILHLGHIVHFHYSKSQGDVLVVSLGNDETVRLLKGPTRPINDQRFRARMIAALETVDYVVISEELGKMDHSRLVDILKPDVYVVPATDSMLKEKQALVLAYGGQFITCHRLPPGGKKGGISTTSIEARLNQEAKNIRDIFLNEEGEEVCWA